MYVCVQIHTYRKVCIHINVQIYVPNAIKTRNRTKNVEVGQPLIYIHIYINIFTFIHIYIYICIYILHI
jgi:hypothetical protein